ncbi:uncharacterized protein LOC135144218 isoform X2 [Zophobas morio]|uniref:uncharacterized protein LOC135144218 isoform X2 n=1 Tax=Zophobas morio TaxID=2755281 RepID=UPI003082D64E
MLLRTCVFRGNAETCLFAKFPFFNFKQFYWKTTEEKTEETKKKKERDIYPAISHLYNFKFKNSKKTFAYLCLDRELKKCNKIELANKRKPWKWFQGLSAHKRDRLLFEHLHGYRKGYNHRNAPLLPLHSYNHNPKLVKHTKRLLKGKSSSQARHLKWYFLNRATLEKEQRMKETNLQALEKEILDRKILTIRLFGLHQVPLLPSQGKKTSVLRIESRSLSTATETPFIKVKPSEVQPLLFPELKKIQENMLKKINKSLLTTSQMRKMKDLYSKDPINFSVPKLSRLFSVDGRTVRRVIQSHFERDPQQSANYDSKILEMRKQRMQEKKRSREVLFKGKIILKQPILQRNLPTVILDF